MELTTLRKILGHKETRPDLKLAQRLEKLLRNLERPPVSQLSKFWIAKEIRKAKAPLLFTIPFEKEGQFAVIWAQNRKPYGLMLFAQSKWPNIDHDLWAYTRSKYRGHNIAKLTLAEGIRQLTFTRKGAILTGEILIENQKTRRSTVRWINSLGFVASKSESESLYKRLYIAAYTKEVLQTALHTLPPEYQKPKNKMPPMPPDILASFTAKLKDSFDAGGRQLLSRRRSAY